MTHEAVVKRHVVVNGTPEQVFTVFTEQFDSIKPHEHNLLQSALVETVLEPHVGGGPFHGARALHRLRVPARIVARCSVDDKALLLPPLVRLGTPVRYVEGRATTRWIMMLVSAVVAWVGLVAYHVSVHLQARRVDAETRAAGVDPPDEPRVPIRWAQNRESLVAGLIALAIIAAVFVWYYAGGFGAAR